jgi:uncharacterized protein YuzE
MKLTYNSENDSLCIVLSEAPIKETESHPSGLILDYGPDGRIVGLELTSASHHISRGVMTDITELAVKK